jgi:hypothetical protein
MASCDPLNETDSVEWMKRQLGCGVIVIELSDAMLTDAFCTAIRWYIARKGVKRLAVANLVPGISEYAMPDDTDEVLRVDFPGGQIDAIAAVNPYAFIDVEQLPVAYQSITGVPGGSFYGTYHQMLSHAETARRIMGSEPAWDYYKDENIIRVAPANGRGGSAVVRYASNKLVTVDPVLPDTTPKNDFANLRVRDRDVILRYALAWAKQTLGRIRGKYTEWPGAGGSKSLDGDTLLMEAREDMDALTIELIGLSDPVSFLTG